MFRGSLPVDDAQTMVRHLGLDNHGMGTIFEELIRKFNEENNEEAGERMPQNRPLAFAS